MFNYQRVNPIKSHEQPPFSSGFPMVFLWFSLFFQNHKGPKGTEIQPRGHHAIDNLSSHLSTGPRSMEDDGSLVILRVRVLLEGMIHRIQYRIQYLNVHFHWIAFGENRQFLGNHWCLGSTFYPLWFSVKVPFSQF